MKKIVVTILLLLAGLMSFAAEGKKQDTVKEEKKIELTAEQKAVLQKREDYFKKNYSDKNGIKKSIKLENDTYNLVWSGYHDSGTASFEFLRKGETMDKYNRLISVISLSPYININLYMKSYLASVKQYMINQPTAVKNKKSKFKDDILMDFILADEKEDVMEYTQMRACINEKNEGIVYVLSIKFKLSEMKKDKEKFKKEIDDKAVNWAEDMFKIDFVPFN